MASTKLQGESRFTKLVSGTEDGRRLGPVLVAEPGRDESYRRTRFVPQLTTLGVKALRHKYILAKKEKWVYDLDRGTRMQITFSPGGF